jgi:Ulp1 family protease
VALKCALAISSETLDIASWEIVLGNTADVPEQENSSDCGIFTLMFVYSKSLGKRPRFSQVDVPVFRRRIDLDLLRKTQIDHTK